MFNYENQAHVCICSKSNFTNCVFKVFQVPLYTPNGIFQLCCGFLYFVFGEDNTFSPQLLPMLVKPSCSVQSFCNFTL